MTGEPVSIRRYLLYFVNTIKFFVRCALRFLIVVLSSTIIILSGFCTRKRPAARAPRGEENASTFITNIFIPSKSSIITSSNSAAYFLLEDGIQLTVLRAIRSGRCNGISPNAQLSYTPLGATISAAVISPFSKRTPMLSIATLLFPVPISIKYA